jgi:hypothetical protein
MDVHLSRPVSDGLRRRGISVLTSQEDGTTEWSDDRLLTRATELGRAMVTQDADFLAIAQARQERGESFAGVIYSHPLNVTIGDLVRDLELIAECGTPEDHVDRIIYLPL